MTRRRSASLSIAQLALIALTVVTSPVTAQSVPKAIFTDPPRDKQHPARMEVLHIPSADVHINGVAYLAVGAGPHPTLVLLHGLPGNEKNLDLAQAVRRAGWHAITVNYRGSWGSPGVFRFAQTLEDARAVLAFLRNPANAKKFGIDTTRLVLAGHSMGGWVTAHVAAGDHGLRGAILISAADMGLQGTEQRGLLVSWMAGDLESLAGTGAEQMADELIANASQWKFDQAVAGLASMPLLVLSTDDGLAPQTDSLVQWVRARGNRRVTSMHVATDHSWSDRRILLQARVLNWLQSLAAPAPKR